MNLQTPVVYPKANFDITHRSSMVVLGSCFTENIGSKLEENKFSVNVNPFGILYNPLSIYSAIDRLLSKQAFSEEDFVLHNGIYHSLMHHGSFSDTKLDEAVDKVNSEFNMASAQLDVADFLLITFGTSYVFRWKETGEIVGNCHKIPAKQFTRERLSVEEITLVWRDLIKRILTHKPDLRILFTVSPIRHFKDGAHENQLSKSILHLSIDNLMHQFPANAFYFPAYEIMIDQLRDYRFYADDMLHPSTLAQEYIWKRFGESYFSEETQSIIAEWHRIHEALSHSPNNASSEAYQIFLLRTIDDIKAFEKKQPYISCSNEKECLTQMIKTIQ